MRWPEIWGYIQFWFLTTQYEQHAAIPVLHEASVIPWGSHQKYRPSRRVVLIIQLASWRWEVVGGGGGNGARPCFHPNYVSRERLVSQTRICPASGNSRLRGRERNPLFINWAARHPLDLAMVSPSPGRLETSAH